MWVNYKYSDESFAFSPGQIYLLLAGNVSILLSIVSYVLFYCLTGGNKVPTYKQSNWCPNFKEQDLIIIVMAMTLSPSLGGVQ